jgi:predicted signal transduction protein with EAL and GGDEF domain
VARLGGDEFAVLLPDVDAVAATPLAVKQLRALEPPFTLGAHSLELGASVGIALYPEHGQTAEALLRHADVALYAAKRAGGGIALYDPEQDLHTVDRLTLIGKLRTAIEREQLLLHFQPKLDLGSGQLAGVEALVRWQHPERGLVPPDEFILLAEQTGLIKPLTQWVLAAGLRQCRAWREQGFDVPMAVNLSMRDLHDPRLPALLAALLDSSGIAPAWLCLEITESAAMADPDQTLQILARLRQLGVGLAIDDFGTGYSSLSYLKRLPVQELKIDRGFVREIARNEDDLAIVRATIELGHSMGLEVVAEGVEDEAGWRLLDTLGCDLAQGYYMSRPLPAPALLPWLQEWRSRHEPGRPLAADGASLSALTRVKLLRGLPPEGLRQLARLGHPRTFPAHSRLMQQGEPSDVVFVLITGRVRVERGEEGGTDTIVLAELGPGETVGEMGALERLPRSATVIALEETETIELSAMALAATVLQYPQVEKGLLRLLSRRLRSADDLVELLVHATRAAAER